MVTTTCMRVTTCCAAPQQLAHFTRLCLKRFDVLRCYTIWTAAGITQEQLAADNPGLDCSNLQISQVRGAEVCPSIAKHHTFIAPFCWFTGPGVTATLELSTPCRCRYPNDGATYTCSHECDITGSWRSRQVNSSLSEGPLPWRDMGIFRFEVRISMRADYKEGMPAAGAVCGQLTHPTAAQPTSHMRPDHNSQVRRLLLVHLHSRGHHTGPVLHTQPRHQLRRAASRPGKQICPCLN